MGCFSMSCNLSIDLTTEMGVTSFAYCIYKYPKCRKIFKNGQIKIGHFFRSGSQSVSKVLAEFERLFISWEEIIDDSRWPVARVPRVLVLVVLSSPEFELEVESGWAGVCD